MKRSTHTSTNAAVGVVAAPVGEVAALVVRMAVVAGAARAETVAASEGDIPQAQAAAVTAVEVSWAAAVVAGKTVAAAAEATSVAAAGEAQGRTGMALWPRWRRPTPERSLGIAGPSAALPRRKANPARRIAAAKWIR